MEGNIDSHFLTRNTTTRPRKVSRFYVGNNVSGERAKVSMIKIDIKALNRTLRLIPAQEDSLAGLREQVIQDIEKTFHAILKAEFRSAFMFQIGKNIISQPKEAMNLQPFLEEMYILSPASFSGDEVTMRFNIPDLEMQYEFIKFILPRLRSQTTVAVHMVRQYDKTKKALKNRVMKVEHNPDYYNINICSIRGDLKNSYILRVLTIICPGNTEILGRNYSPLRLLDLSDSDSQGPQVEDVYFLEENELVQFLSVIDTVRKVEEEEDEADEQDIDEFPSIQSLESKESSNGDTDNGEKNSKRNSAELTLGNGVKVGSLQDIPVDGKSKESPTTTAAPEERKSNLILMRKYGSEGRIESDLQRVIREKQKLKLDCHEFPIKLYGTFGIKHKRILRFNDDFEFVILKKEKEKGTETYTYMFHIPMNDVASVEPRDKNNISKFIFIFKNEKKYLKSLKIDFEQSEMAKQFYESWKRIYRLFASSTNSFETEKEQEHNDKRYSWLVGPKSDQVSVEYDEHGRMKTIQFKVVNVSSFGESQILQINLVNAILLFKLSDNTTEKRIGLRDIMYCETDSKDIRGLNLVLKNEKKYYLIFCDNRSRLLFEAAVYNTITPQYRLADKKVIEPEQLKVYCTSFNAGFALPENRDLNLWLGKSKESNVIAISMQECDTAIWLEAIQEYYAAENFALVTLSTMWKILIIVFVSADYATYVNSVDVGSKPTGIADILGNKGGVAISFRILETSFCFLGCHLAAQPDKGELRKANFYSLMKHLRLGDDKLEITASHDYCFFLGDANFRIDYDFFKTVEAISRDECESLLVYDQLLNAQFNDNFMSIFQEGKICFKPTYRRNREDTGYSNKKNQSPSWTDRILVKTRPNRPAQLIEYDSAEMFFMSDHRPVFSVHKCKVDPPYLPKRPLYLQDPNLLGIIKFVNMNLEYKYSLHEKMSEIEEGLMWPASFKINFRGRFLSKFATTTPLEYKGSSKGITWQQEMIPLLYCVIVDRRFLKEQSLLAVIKTFTEEDETEAMIGQVDIPLSKLVERPGEKVDFRSVVYFYGRNFGVLSGMFLYDLS